MSDLDNTNTTLRKFEPLLHGLPLHELTILNKMVVERIRFMHKAGTLVSMSKFNIGDRVAWNGSDGIIRTEIIVRINTKTASVRIGNGGHWNVSPQLVQKEN